MILIERGKSVNRIFFHIKNENLIIKDYYSIRHTNFTNYCFCLKDRMYKDNKKFECFHYLVRIK
jgi:hypothetical protein